MARAQQAESDQEAQRRSLALEAALLGLLLRRRKRSVEAELRKGLDPSDSIVQAISSSIFTGRNAARLLGRNSIADRFGGVGSDPVAALVDSARAQQLARRHLEWVRREALRAQAAALREAKSLTDAAAWRKGLELTEWRLATVAATETHSAVNAERVQAAREASAATGIELWKTWNAEIDACPVCRESDGETVRVEDRFANGEPGSVHAQCRCWVEIHRRH